MEGVYLGFVFMFAPPFAFVVGISEDRTCTGDDVEEGVAGDREGLALLGLALALALGDLAEA